MKAASRAVASSLGGSTRITVAAVAGSSASPATVNSSCWNRGRDGWLSQLAAVGRSPAGEVRLSSPGQDSWPPQAVGDRTSAAAPRRVRVLVRHLQ